MIRPQEENIYKYQETPLGGDSAAIVTISDIVPNTTYSI
jgi:hypothetical protein